MSREELAAWADSIADTYVWDDARVHRVRSLLTAFRNDTRRMTSTPGEASPPSREAV